MKHESAARQQIYREFIEFIGKDIQRERLLVHRRMFSVFLWCFVLPALLSLSVLLLVKFHFLPMRARGWVEGVSLIFPVCYSLYILGSEVLAQIPATLKRGGISGTLNQAVRESEWRERARDSMHRSVHAHGNDWKWIIESFRLDLESMQYRTRYLTVLAGAVFFLLMQGIDMLGSDPETLTSAADGTDFSQFVGLTLFLVLLYLSGSQTYHSLRRYLRCAEMNSMDGATASSIPTHVLQGRD